MQPVYSRSERQRPLQKSMFLTATQQYPNKNNSVQYQYQGQMEMKRSTINIETNKPVNYPLNNQSYQQNQQFTQHSTQVLNFNQTPRHKELPKSHFPLMNQNNNTPSEINLKQLAEKLQKVTGLVQNHEQMLKHLNLPSFKQKTPFSGQINEIQVKLKQTIIPTLINQSTKQIYEHLFNSKFQIQTLRDEVQSFNQKYKVEVSNFIKEANLGASKNTSSSTLSNDRIEEAGSEFSSSLYSLENKILQIQKNIQHKDEYLKSFIYAEIQKSTQISQNLDKKQTRSSFRSSAIQSTLPPILIEYQQFFSIKNFNNPPNKLNFHQNREESHNPQILINSCAYQIDKQGFLLDNQNRYIIDQKGAQIKLDQKHLTILRQHHILGN